VIVPHLGAARMDETAALLARHDNLHLDTTMALAGLFPLDARLRETDEAAARAWLERARAIVRAHPDRVLYGTDFPNVPYAWNHELSALAAIDLPDEALHAILGGNARRLFGIQ
jgi:predicted TIM-barrel fold metal-dependent hydrolase